jgi:DNA primase
MNHPELLVEFGEEFGRLDLADDDLDKLRQAIINLAAAQPGLDAAALKRHLNERGFTRPIDDLWQDANVRASFARPEASPEAARHGWHQCYLRLLLPNLRAERDDAQRAFTMDQSEDRRVRWEAAKQELKAAEDQAALAEAVEADRPA